MVVEKEGEPQNISKNRIYNVPPERRERVFRLRTAFLQVYSKLEQEGKISPLSDRERRKVANMKPSEVLRFLGDDQPLMKLYVLETMTVEEFAEYVNSFPDRESPLLRAKRYVTNFLIKKGSKSKIRIYRNEFTYYTFLPTALLLLLAQQGRA